MGQARDRHLKSAVEGPGWVHRHAFAVRDDFTVRLDETMTEFVEILDRYCDDRGVGARDGNNEWVGCFTAE